MSPEDGKIKKIIVEVDSDLHRKFKSAVYNDDRTIKTAITEYIELYVKSEEKERAKKQETS